MKKETVLNILGPLLFVLLWQCLQWFGIIDPYYIPGPSDLVETFLFKIQNWIGN
jgi:ABC-type nitrate/sulfonate/bicarbonate transport system permease component